MTQENNKVDVTVHVDKIVRNVAIAGVLIVGGNAEGELFGADGVSGPEVYGERRWKRKQRSYFLRFGRHNNNDLCCEDPLYAQFPRGERRGAGGDAKRKRSRQWGHDLLRGHAEHQLCGSDRL